MLGKDVVTKEVDLSPTVVTSGFVASGGLLLTPDFKKIEPTLEHDSIVVKISFSFVNMILLGKHGVPQELDLFPIVLTLGFVATVELLLTADFEMIEAKLEPDSLVVTPSLQLLGMTLLDETGVPQQIDLSPTVLTLVTIAMVGLLLLDS